MPFPNLTNLALDRLVDQIIGDECGVELHGRVWDKGKEASTKTRPRGKSSGRSQEGHKKVLFRMPGDLQAKGIPFFFFKALRANLEHEREGYYHRAETELAASVPSPLHTATEIRHTYRTDDENAEYEALSAIWKRYLSLQDEIWAVLLRRFETNSKESMISLPYQNMGYWPPYLKIPPEIQPSYPEIEPSASWDRLLPNQRAVEIVKRGPLFGLHRGAFQIASPWELEGSECQQGRRKLLADSLVAFECGKMEDCNMQDLDLTTFELMREIPLSTRRVIYAEFFDLVARDMRHGRHFYDPLATASDVPNDAAQNARRQRVHAMDAFENIIRWEKNIVLIRLFHGHPSQNPPAWSPDEINLPSDQWNDVAWNLWVELKRLNNAAVGGLATLSLSAPEAKPVAEREAEPSPSAGS